MLIIPQQYFGLGDCIFIQSLLRQLCDQNSDRGPYGDSVLYPILPQFVEGCARAYPDTVFIDYNCVRINYESRIEVARNGMRILPIRFADQILKRPYTDCMRAKYDLFGLDWQTWREAMYVRDMPREFLLARQINDANGWDPKQRFPKYNLISDTFGSDFRYRGNISVDNGLPNVYLTRYSGYSLFDWSYLIEHAATIHASSSSILYLLELLELQAEEVHLYARKPIEPHFKNVDYLFTKDYILHV